MGFFRMIRYSVKNNRILKVRVNPAELSQFALGKRHHQFVDRNQFMFSVVFFSARKRVARMYEYVHRAMEMEHEVYRL